MRRKAALMTKKSVGFAYPTSISAGENGYYKTGCWLVETVSDCMTTKKTVKAFPADQKAEAIAFADSLPEEYHPLFLKYQ